MTIKVTQDKFVWKIITPKEAEHLLMNEMFEVYVLHVDGSESLIHTFAEIDTACRMGLSLALEVGYLTDEER